MTNPTKKKGTKNLGGHPEVSVTPDKIRQLELVWAMDGSDREAAFYANVPPSTLCEYLQRHPEVAERKEALKNKPVLKARQEVVKGLDGNPEFSLKYLERKLPDEFSLKQKFDTSGEIRLKNEHSLSEADRQLIKKIGDIRTGS